MTTKQEIREWLDNSFNRDATHMLVAVDKFDWEDFPVYTNDVWEAIKKYQGDEMSGVMEVYNLAQDFETQLSEQKAWNI